jgi:hypothetical protein
VVSDAALPPYFERVFSAELPSDWIETGIGLMVLPLTCAIVAMMAPMIWMFAPKVRR